MKCYEEKKVGAAVSLYDEQCARESAQLESQLERYFVEMAVECPYHLPREAVFYQALFGPLPDRTMEIFWPRGIGVMATASIPCIARIVVHVFPFAFILRHLRRIGISVEY